jgi:uncharacterized membrane protein YbhN (UPF0104 family)
LATALPISIGGIGVGEWTFVYIFTKLGTSKEMAISISLIYLLVRLTECVIGAALYLMARGRVRDA